MLKVTYYRSTKYQNTTTKEVERITAMPGPEEITEEDRHYADGIMLCLDCADGSVTFIPHSFLISIE